jgi:hypothetical protein
MSVEMFSEVAEHFNEPMLAGFDVVRCIGYGEDEDDCYVIYRRPGGEIIWHTMVGGYMFLSLLKMQGRVVSTTGEEWNDLSRLDNMLTLNDAPKEDKMMCVFRDDETRSAEDYRNAAGDFNGYITWPKRRIR